MLATWAILVLIALMMALISIGIVYDINRRGCSNEIGWPYAFIQYIVKFVRCIRIAKHYKYTLDATRNFTKCQDQLLRSIMRHHEDTAFGREKRFSGIRNYKIFRRELPVVDYEHVRQRTERVAAGETSALLPANDPVVLIACSAGTQAGSLRQFPLSRSQVAVTMQYWLYGSHRLALLRDVAEWNLRKNMFVVTKKHKRLAKSGVRLGTIEELMVGALGFFDMVSTPPAGMRIKDEAESHYIHALFGLRDAQLNSIQVFLLPTFVSLVNRMVTFQLDLINDIKYGEIKKDLNISEKIRSSLTPFLTPMPERAEAVMRAFAGGARGLVARLWPQLRYVLGNHSGITGTGFYNEAVQFCGDTIPILSYSYSCTEAGLLGLILDYRYPAKPVYTLMPDAAFYEFIPVTDDQITPTEEIQPENVVRIDSMMLGCDYELVLTTRSGLYRYRLGHVLKLVGYYNEAPQFQFLYRSGLLLNILTEKVTHQAFQEVLDEVCNQHWPRAVKVVDYTVTNSLLLPKHAQETGIPYHVLFIELDGPSLSKAYTDMVDECLSRRDQQYCDCRESNRLGAIAVYQLQPDTFQQYGKYVARKHTPTDPHGRRKWSQPFKVPRALKSADGVQWFLQRRTVSTTTRPVRVENRSSVLAELRRKVKK